MTSQAATNPETRRPQPRRRTGTVTRSNLSWTAQIMVNTLGLESPRADAPGYWRTSDDFICMDAGVLKYGYKAIEQRMVALVSFRGEGVQKKVRETVAREMEERDDITEDERRVSCFRILQLGKQVRTQRVKKVVASLAKAGIDIPMDTITVHRVSNSFYVDLDLNALNRITQLHQRGWNGIRSIKITQVAV